MQPPLGHPVLTEDESVVITPAACRVCGKTEGHLNVEPRYRTGQPASYICSKCYAIERAEQP